MTSNKNFYSIIESMDYPEWLHTCNPNSNAFNNNPNSVIVIKDYHIPTSVYIEEDDENKGPDMLLAFLQQFTNHFKYDFKGTIQVVNDEFSWQSNRKLHPGFRTYLFNNQFVFLDSTLFFNKSMQGKYIPFMWDNKLWYFHFNHNLT